MIIWKKWKFNIINFTPIYYISKLWHFWILTKSNKFFFEQFWINFFYHSSIVFVIYGKDSTCCEALGLLSQRPCFKYHSFLISSNPQFNNHWLTRMVGKKSFIFSKILFFHSRTKSNNLWFGKSFFFFIFYLEFDFFQYVAIRSWDYLNISIDLF